MKRAKLTGLRRNLAVAIGNSREADAVRALVEDAVDQPSTANSIVREHVAWALEQGRDT
jgi:epoxyqueuosine reductase QueG